MEDKIIQQSEQIQDQQELKYEETQNEQQIENQNYDFQDVDEESLKKIDQMTKILTVSYELISGYQNEMTFLKDQISQMHNQIAQDKSSESIPQGMAEIGAVYKEQFDTLIDQNQLLQQYLQNEMEEKKLLESSLEECINKINSLESRVQTLHAQKIDQKNQQQDQ